ncbi:39174_t:CDS:2 [Gigaspora margarita]|uniref:39174_t:CDS:1 n=1 Tax=Gigaspora margarita TaxID=4874 RepID=A0ABN7V6Q1_GIGMA|nr:39174_t:CDS:2 [Gigaspora margarita]
MASGLPPGWISQYDPNSQKHFYVNQATGASQWEHPGPVGPPPSGPPSSGPPTSGPPPSGPPSDSGLPPGWISQYDPSSQKYFYVNQATGVSQWQHPGHVGPPSGPPPSGPPASQYSQPQYGAPQSGNYPQNTYGQPPSGGYGQQPPPTASYQPPPASKQSDSKSSSDSNKKGGFSGLALAGAAGVGLLGGFLATEAVEGYEEHKHKKHEEEERRKHEFMHHHGGQRPVEAFESDGLFSKKTEKVYVDSHGNEEVIETKSNLFGTKTEIYRRDRDDDYCD